MSVVKVDFMSKMVPYLQDKMIDHIKSAFKVMNKKMVETEIAVLY